MSRDLVMLHRDGRTFIVGECLKCGAGCAAAAGSMLTCIDCTPLRPEVMPAMPAKMSWWHRIVSWFVQRPTDVELGRVPRPSRFDDVNELLMTIRTQALAMRPLRELPAPRDACRCSSCTEEIGSCHTERAERRAQRVPPWAREVPMPDPPGERLE